MRTKLCDWAFWQARACCYSQAALYSNDSKTLYLLDDLGVARCELVLDGQGEEGVGVSLLQARQQVVQQPVQRLRLQRRRGLRGCRRLGARNGGGRRGRQDLRCLRHIHELEPVW